MTGAAPLVSVLFTTYNHAPYIEQALDSITAQGLTDLEVVITDDCSTDGSADVIHDWLSRHDVDASVVVHERNLGICAVRNRALARARGELVCSLSGDDLFAPDRLERQAPFLAAQPADVAAVYSDARICDAGGATLHESYLDRFLGPGEPPQGSIFAALQQGCFLPAPAVLVRRSAIEAVGGYDESLAFEDWDMWLRLAHRYRFAYLPMQASSWRVLPTSMSHGRIMSPAFKASEIRIHERWLGLDPQTDIRAAHWIRHAALVLSRHDRAAALAALDRVRDVPADDDLPWDAIRRLLAVPGGGTALASLVGVRRRLRRAA